MVKTMFLVPLNDNDGQPFEADDWRELERQLLQFGGFSSGALVEGAWEAGGKVYRDTSREFVVGLESWKQLSKWLAVIDWVRVTFRQEAIYIEVAGIPEIVGDE